MKNRLLIKSVACLALWFSVAHVGAEPAFLPADQAFKVSARLVGNRQVEVQYDIAEGYHLYKNKLTYETDTVGVKIAEVLMPPARSEFDRALGEVVDFYTGHVTVRVALTGGKVPARLTTRGQGCYAGRLCLPPFAKSFTVPAS